MLCTEARLALPGQIDLARRRALASYKGLYGSWPGYDYDPHASVQMDVHVKNKVMANRIAWSKRRKQASQQAATA